MNSSPEFTYHRHRKERQRSERFLNGDLIQPHPCDSISQKIVYLRWKTLWTCLWTITYMGNEAPRAEDDKKKPAKQLKVSCLSHTFRALLFCHKWPRFSFISLSSALQFFHLHSLHRILQSVYSCTFASLKGDKKWQHLFTKFLRFSFLSEEKTNTKLAHNVNRWKLYFSLACDSFG